jgi:hypothetical protein
VGHIAVIKAREFMNSKEQREQRSRNKKTIHQSMI